MPTSMGGGQVRPTWTMAAIPRILESMFGFLAGARFAWLNEVQAVWFLYYLPRFLSLQGFSWLVGRDENGTDIFRSYSRPNLFKGVLIRPYPSPDI
jgi:hypothetical protein